MRQRRSEQCQLPRTGKALCVLGAAALIAALWMAGCTPEERYPVLTFFFDGVPPPGQEATWGKKSKYFAPDDPRGVVSQVPMFFHTPYLQEKCRDCHPEQRSLWLGEDRRRGLCGTCHEHDKFKAKVESYAFVHGPVAAEACLVCHDAHESVYKGVLTQPDPKLCRDCHDILTGSAAPFHHSAVKEECLPCHDPHGGSNRFFIKEGVKEGVKEG